MRSLQQCPNLPQVGGVKALRGVSLAYAPTVYRIWYQKKVLCLPVVPSLWSTSHHVRLGRMLSYLSFPSAEPQRTYRLYVDGR